MFIQERYLNSQNSHKNSYVNVQSSLIHYCQKLEPAQMSQMVYGYTNHDKSTQWILLNKKEKTDTHKQLREISIVVRVQAS